MKKRFRKSFAVWMVGTICFCTQAQDLKNQFNPVHTAIMSLSIAPDARGGSMGDNGVATLPDVNSQYWNPSKYAFMSSKAGLSISYTPWLRKLVNDVAMTYAAGYYKLGSSDLSAISASLRYFSLGYVPLTDYGGKEYLSLNPYEMAFDASYSMKLSESSSLAVTLRYIRSDMGADEALWSGAFNVSNIGTKISFDGGTTQQFLPAKLNLGMGLLYPFDEYNQIGFYLDVSKYLVPTHPIRRDDESDENFEKRKEAYNAMSSLSAAWNSFSDAPGGANEELKEINLSLGMEYSYNSQFFVRGGYYYENPMKGNRQYFSVGAGFKMNVFQLDAAYLISTVQNNPLDQTLRVSLSFDMDGLRSLFE